MKKIDEEEEEKKKQNKEYEGWQKMIEVLRPNVDELIDVSKQAYRMTFASIVQECQKLKVRLNSGIKLEFVSKLGYHFVLKSSEFNKISQEQLEDLKIHKIVNLNTKVRFTLRQVVALNNRLIEIEEEIVIRS